MGIKFCSFGSGSSGNCYFIGNKLQGLLIDAGIGVRKIKAHLKTSDISLQSIMGILITHNHFDHVKSLKIFANRYKIPIYTSEQIGKNIIKNRMLRGIDSNQIQKITLKHPLHLAGFTVEAFPVSHDAPETIGFHICFQNRKITLATDLGYICESASKYIRDANFLVIESNYDEHMLLNGNYPTYLKKRISSNNGHLDNKHTSSFLAENIHADLTHICFAHLSQNNNTPEKVMETFHKTFREKGIRIKHKPEVIVLDRFTPSEFISLTKHPSKSMQMSLQL